MLSPLPRRSGWAYSSLCFTQPYQPSPKGLSGRPAHCPFRGLPGVHSRYGLHTRAVTNSWHANRRLQPLRYLHDCSDCFRLERLPGGGCTHWKARPLPRAHPSAYIISDETLSKAEPYGIMLGKDDAPFKTVVDRATANLYRSPEIEVIYKKCFESPVPPNGLNFRTPMTAVLRNAFAYPSDSPDPASYER